MKACLFSCVGSRPASPSSPELEAALEKARAEAEPVISFSDRGTTLFKPVPSKASLARSLQLKSAPGPALEMDPELPASPQQTAGELNLENGSCMAAF